MPSALRASAAASGVSRPRPSAVATKVPMKLASSVGHSRRIKRHQRGAEPALPDVGESAGMTISAAASPGDMIRLSSADRDRRQALAQHAFDEAGEHEGEARDGEDGNVESGMRGLTAPRRASAGAARRPARRPRAARRGAAGRSGRSGRGRGRARSAPAGNRTSSVRLSRSTASVRLFTSARRSAS